MAGSKLEMEVLRVFQGAAKLGGLASWQTESYRQKIRSLFARARVENVDELNRVRHIVAQMLVITNQMRAGAMADLVLLIQQLDQICNPRATEPAQPFDPVLAKLGDS